MTKPVRIALTGGIGSGKTTALAMFAARGAAILSSDLLVHKLLQRRDVRQSVADSLGIGHLRSGEQGRSQLADIVFTDEDQLTRLETLLFPLVRQKISEWMESGEAATAPAAVVEIPMLIESGMKDLFDAVVLVTAPAEVRRARHAGRVSRADFERRASRQTPEEAKREQSDYVYENTGSPDELDEFVERVMVELDRSRAGNAGG
jgi:dephospho-CoA kinase